jgi:hypothetical protein
LNRVRLRFYPGHAPKLIVAEPTAQGATKMKTFTIDAENTITVHASRSLKHCNACGETIRAARFTAANESPTATQRPMSPCCVSR